MNDPQVQMKDPHKYQPYDSVLKEADKLKNKGDKDMNMAATYHGKIVTLVSKLNDLTNSSRHSVDNSRAALDTMERAHMPVLMV